jgi:hypothetical protein
MSHETKENAAKANASDRARERKLSKAIPLQTQGDASKRAAEIRAKRAERGYISGPQQRLAVPEELKSRDWTYRWVNDSDMRIQNMLDRDWEFAESELAGKSEQDKGLGSRVERTVNERSTRAPQSGFLMRKPKEIYEEDQARKEQARKQREREMERGKHREPDALAGPHLYVPAGNKI